MFILRQATARSSEYVNFNCLFSVEQHPDLLSMLILIVYFKVSNIARPSEYENAIRSKERAREDIQVMLDEEQQ